MEVCRFTIFHKGWEKCEEETRGEVWGFCLFVCLFALRKKKRKQSKTDYQKMIERMEWHKGLFYVNFHGKGLTVTSEKYYTEIRELTSEKIRKWQY